MKKSVVLVLALFSFTKYVSLPVSYYSNSDSSHLISSFQLQQPRQRNVDIFMFLLWPVDGEEVPEHGAPFELSPGRVWFYCFLGV